MDYSLDLDPANVCRICLQTSDKLVSIYTKQIIDGEIRTMPEIIKSCFNIDISQLELLPHKICELCKVTVLSFVQFKEKFVRSEMVLHKLFLSNSNATENNEQTDEVNLFNDEYEINNEIEDSQNDILSTRTNNDEDNYIENLEELDHEVIKIDNVETVENLEELDDEAIKIVAVETVECDEKTYDSPVIYDFSQIEELSQNQTGDERFNEQINKSEVNEDYDIPSEQQTSPQSCDESIDNNQGCESKDIESSSKDIITYKRGEWFLCKICNKKTRKDNTEHEKFHQSLFILSENTDIFICNNCPRAYIQTSAFVEHKNYCTKHSNEDVNDEYTDIQFLDDDDDTNQILVCGICNISYENSKDLKCHMMIHLSHYECPFYECGFQYDSFHYFSIHIKRKHLTESTQICKYCKQENIEDFEQLKKHYLVCSERNLKCAECEKTFCSSKALQSHIRLRHKSKKFVCEVCGKSFAQTSELNIHTRIHTGERPFSCTICGKNFKTASVRSAHMETHSQAKFKCTFCNKILGSKRCYHTHIKRHTQEKKHKCSFCGKRFFTNWHLKMHHSKIHKNVEFKKSI